MIKREFIYLSFFILFSYSIEASTMEKSVSSNNIDSIFDKGEEKVFDNDFDVVASSLENKIRKLHNAIVFGELKKEDCIDPIIKSFSALSKFLRDFKENFKFHEDIAELATFIEEKIVTPSKEKEQAKKINDFLCRLSGDLNAFCEALYSLELEKKKEDINFCNFLRELLNEQEIEGALVSVNLLHGKRPHFNVKVKAKGLEKYDLSNLFIKVINDKDEVIECKRWNGQAVKNDEKENALSSLLGKNKNSFSLCFPKSINPTSLKVIVYSREKENEIVFSF